MLLWYCQFSCAIIHVFFPLTFYYEKFRPYWRVERVYSEHIYLPLDSILFNISYICFMIFIHLFIYLLSINVLFIYTFESKLPTSVHFNSKHFSYAYQVEFNICLLFLGGNIYWMKCTNFKWWVLTKCIYTKIHVYVSSDSLAWCEVWKSLLLPHCLSQ